MGDEEFAGALAGKSEVEVGFLRAEDGVEVFLPVWFTVYGSKLELLPMYGLKTKWFQRVTAQGGVALRVGSRVARKKPAILRQGGAVDDVKRRFAAKYGEDEVKRYYPTSEVALEVELR